MNNYYTPSGKFSPMAFVYLLLACVLVMPILGGIYAYAVWYIPIIYLNFLVTLVFGFVISFVTKYVISLGKVRNFGLALAISAIIFLVAYYIHWAFWIDLVLNAGESYGNKRIGITLSNVNLSEVFTLIINPFGLFGLISEVNSVGTWGLRGFTPTGIILALFWLVELGIIAFMAVFAPASKAKEPFNELTNEWFKSEDVPLLSYIEETSAFKKEAEQGNWQELLPQITKEEDAAKNQSLFRLFRSGNEFYLSVTNKKAEVNDKGEVKFNDDEFIQYLRINKEIYDEVKKISLTK